MYLALIINQQSVALSKLEPKVLFIFPEKVDFY